MAMEWDAIVERDLRDWKWKSLQATVSKLALGSGVYNPWKKLRNDLKFGNVLLYEEKLLQNVRREVRNRTE
jgi:hypothetical protein